MIIWFYLTGLILSVTSSWRNPSPSFVLLPMGLIPLWVRSNLCRGQWKDWHRLNRRWFRINGSAACQDGGVFLLSRISFALTTESSPTIKQEKSTIPCCVFSWFSLVGQGLGAFNPVPLVPVTRSFSNWSWNFQFSNWSWNMMTLSAFCWSFCTSFFAVLFFFFL